VISLAAATLLATSMRLAASHEYPDGAPPGFSGGFKEDSCTACHFSFDLNQSPGRLVIEGVPAKFTPGEKYTLTVILTRPEMKRAGFQLTARFKDSGLQAGALASGAEQTSRIGVEASGGIQYANQKKEGASVSAENVRWTIEWTAPSGSAPVVFHVSANAADGDGTTNGDYIYTASVESTPGP
jgi:hypothetical protein